MKGRKPTTYGEPREEAGQWLVRLTNLDISEVKPGDLFPSSFVTAVRPYVNADDERVFGLACQVRPETIVPGKMYVGAHELEIDEGHQLDVDRIFETEADAESWLEMQDE